MQRVKRASKERVTPRTFRKSGIQRSYGRHGFVSVGSKGVAVTDFSSRDEEERFGEGGDRQSRDILPKNTVFVKIDFKENWK